jgi:hypothetical protein
MIPIDPDVPIETGRLTSVGYWSVRFGVSGEELLAAVDVVGPHADRVEDYLNFSGEN